LKLLQPEQQANAALNQPGL